MRHLQPLRDSIAVLQDVSVGIETLFRYRGSSPPGFETAPKDYASPPWTSRQRSPHRVTFRLHASAALGQRDASPVRRAAFGRLRDASVDIKRQARSYPAARKERTGLGYRGWLMTRTN